MRVYVACMQITLSANGATLVLFSSSHAIAHLCNTYTFAVTREKECITIRVSSGVLKIPCGLLCAPRNRVSTRQTQSLGMEPRGNVRNESNALYSPSSRGSNTSAEVAQQPSASFSSFGTYPNMKMQ